MDLAEVSLRRQLHDWHDHWLAESRYMALRESKVLSFDVVHYLGSLPFLNRYRADLRKSLWNVLQQWHENGPARFLVEARHDFEVMLANQGALADRYEIPPLPVWTRADCFKVLVQKAGTSLLDVDKLVCCAFYGESGSLMQPEPNSFLAGIDSFMEAALTVRIVAAPSSESCNPDYTLRDPS